MVLRSIDIVSNKRAIERIAPTSRCLWVEGKDLLISPRQYYTKDEEILCSVPPGSAHTITIRSTTRP